MYRATSGLEYSPYNLKVEWEVLDGVICVAIISFPATLSAIITTRGRLGGGSNKDRLPLRNS